MPTQSSVDPKIEHFLGKKLSARADCDAGATELVGGTAAHVAILEYEFSSA